MDATRLYFTDKIEQSHIQTHGNMQKTCVSVTQAKSKYLRREIVGGRSAHLTSRRAIDN